MQQTPLTFLVCLSCLSSLSSVEKGKTLAVTEIAEKVGQRPFPFPSSSPSQEGEKSDILRRL